MEVYGIRTPHADTPHMIQLYDMMVSLEATNPGTL